MAKTGLLLGVGLALSVAVNVWFAVGGTADTDSATEDDDGTKTSSKSGGRSEDRSPRKIKACERDLERCETARKAAPVLFGAGRSLSRTENKRTVDEVETAPTPFLCELARDQARAMWKEKEAPMLFALRSSLANPEMQEKDVETAVERFGDSMDLGGADREELSTRYRDIRLKAVEQIRERITADPPDYEGIIKESRALFEEEDRIAGELFGDEAVEKLRNSELESRTTILTIAASLGDLPWDENVLP